MNWTALQAVNLDADLMKKVNMVLSGLFGAAGSTPEALAKQPRGRVEEIGELKKMGLRVRRE